MLSHSTDSVQSEARSSTTSDERFRDKRAAIACTSRKLTELKLLTMLPYPDNVLPRKFRPSWDQGDEILPAIELAVEQINNRSDILPCHQLELVNVDGGCDIVPKASLGIMNSLFGKGSGQQKIPYTENPQTIVGVIGPGCTISTVQMSVITNRPEVELVILHDAGSPLLANRTKYKNSISILGSIHPLAFISSELVRETEWRKIAILCDNTRVYYRLIAEAFVSRLKTELPGVEILFKGPVLRSSYPLFDVRDSLARIAFLFLPLQHARRIMCLAFHWKLVYPGYQWIVVGQTFEDFVGSSASNYFEFTYEGREYNCSYETMLSIALNNSFMIHYQFADEISDKPQLNLTFQEILKFYEAKINDINDKNPNATIAPTYWAYNMYDAVWAWALVLDNLTSRHGELTFEYGNKTLADMILNEFYSINFQGISGRISFNSSNGFVNRQAILYQISNNLSKQISNGTSIFPRNSYIAIPDIVTETGFPYEDLVGFFIMFQSLEFCVVVVLHVLTILYREQKSVKASSLHLSHFVFIGIYLLITATFVLSAYSLDSEEYTPAISSALCQILWVWLFPISFTLVIGTVTVRTWRLYRIFIHYLDPGRFISTPSLITILLLLLIIDLLIATVWTAVDPMQEVLVNFVVENGPANELMQDRVCQSRRLNLLWIVMSDGYRILLLAVMVTLTLLTRKIPNKTYTTSSLRVFSYIFSMVYLLGFTTYYMFLDLFTSHKLNIIYSVLSLTFNTMICLIIVLIVLPPLIPIAREKIFTRGSR